MLFYYSGVYNVFWSFKSYSKNRVINSLTFINYY